MRAYQRVLSMYIYIGRLVRTPRSVISILLKWYLDTVANKSIFHTGKEIFKVVPCCMATSRKVNQPLCSFVSLFFLPYQPDDKNWRDRQCGWNDQQWPNKSCPSRIRFMIIFFILQSSYHAVSIYIVVIITHISVLYILQRFSKTGY